MKKLLIVIDYQKDFVDGTLGFPKAVELENPIVKKIKQYRSNNDDIAFTFDTHEKEYLSTQEGKYLPISHCIKDTDGWQLYGKVADLIESNDKVFYKPSFGSIELFEFIRNTSYSSIELVGVVSNICVLSNAVLCKTAKPEVRVIVDSSCVASNDDSLNEAALKVLKSIQVDVI